MNIQTVPWDKITDFGLIIIGFAVLLIPGLNVPTAAAYVAIGMGLQGLGVNVKINNALGRAR